LDVKSTFFHGNLQEETWNNLLDMFKMNQVVFSTLRNISMVLNKLINLGMLKWKTFFLTSAFVDDILTNVYTKKVGRHMIILFLCLDDLILTGSDPKLLTHLKYILKKKFEMRNRIIALFPWPPSIAN
jgi:hypothetical protein